MCYVLVESAYERVGGVSGAEEIPLPDELFGVVCEVWYEVRDEAGWNKSFGCGLEDFSQLGLP